MQPQNKEDIWISREEYDRLRRLEYNSEQSASQSAAVLTRSDAQDQSLGQDSVSKLAVATAILAVLSFIFPPLLLFFFITGIITMVQATKSRSKKTAGVIGVVLTSVFLVTVAPVGFVILMLLFWSFGCSVSPGECRSV